MQLGRHVEPGTGAEMQRWRYSRAMIVELCLL